MNKSDDFRPEEILKLFKQLHGAKIGGTKIGVPLVQLVMDYAPGDLAVSEVTQALAKLLPRDWQMAFTKAQSFKTTETGFISGQLGLAPRDKNDPPLLLYINCAPRKDQRESRVSNQGEGLVYGVLRNGINVVAVNSKYSLSLLRDHFVRLHQVRVARDGSQFRSRDNFPVVVAAVAHGLDLTSILGEKLNPRKAIPEFKEGYIGYIDSFGNIKTTYPSSSKELKSLNPGDEVEITINGTEIVAQVATGSFSVKEGNFAFAPGSSGWDDRFWEVFQRGGHAAQSFKLPQTGSPVRIKKL